MKRVSLFLAGVPMLLSSCASIVGVEVPSLVPDAQILSASDAEIGDVSGVRWWQEFDDKTLDGLVEKSLAQNLDLQSAESRIRQAKAALSAQGINSILSGNAGTSISRSGGEDIETTDVRGSSFSSGLTLNFGGGTLSALNQAEASLSSAEVEAGSAQMAVVSSVVNAYLEAAYLREAEEISEGIVSRSTTTFGLIENKMEMGAATSLDVVQTRVSLEEAKASLRDVQQARRSILHTLASLLATSTDEVEALLKDSAGIPVPGDSAGIEVPADFLRNIPSVQSAEFGVEAAAAAVGVAKAQLYPSLSLSGSLSATEGVSGWSFGPSLSVPVLNRGALRSNVKQAEEGLEQAHLAWKMAVLKAVQDYGLAGETFTYAQKSQVSSNTILTARSEAMRLTKESYSVGGSSTLDVIDAEQALGSSELSFAGAQRDLATAWAALQVASGKGWKLPEMKKPSI